MSERLQYIPNQRYRSVRLLVQEMIMNIVNEHQKQEAAVQLYGVSSFASMLALQRGLDQELAAVIGLLHHYYFYKTGIKEFPGPNSADTVRPLLREIGIFNKEELNLILKAIFHHEDRSNVQGPYDEIIKDAHLLQLYFNSTDCVLMLQDAKKLRRVFRELSIPENVLDEMSIGDHIEFITNNIDKRSKLAEIAEELGSEYIIGIPGNARYKAICQYWPDKDIYKLLENNWCAAFVYYCCMNAGFLLPIRYPNADYRLAGVGAWLAWAQLPETGFFYMDGQNGFIPQRGDIVIYEKLLTDHSHDHTGIVLSCNDQEIIVAEGNTDNQNYSSILHRDRWHCILGYIRIPNDYRFEFSGEYIPIP